MEKIEKDYRLIKRVIASSKLYIALIFFLMLLILPIYSSAQTTALADPGNMVSYRGDDYTSYYFLVTATNSGNVWGGCNTPFSYTDNSNIGTAIVHFWGLTLGEQWVVQVKVLPGLGSYVGCDNNGITSGTYGSWPGSFQLVNYWSPTLPAVTTNTPYNITETGAKVDCNVGGLGNGSSITNRGVCWNTSSSPTTSNSKTDDGIGTGDYTSTVLGLTSDTKYYIRAYAINNLGQIGYGAEYSFTTSSTKTPQTITFNILVDKTYGDLDFGLSATATSGLTVTFTSGNTSIATITGSQVSIVGVGLVTIYADQTGDAIYSAAPQVLQSFNVSKKQLSVIDAVASNKPYDGNFDALITGGSLTGVINSDDVSIEMPIVGTFSSKNKGVGISITPTVTLVGTQSWKYLVTQPTLSANITAKVLTVTGATAQNKVYDGNTSATIVGGTLSGIVNLEDVILATATTGTFVISNIGVGINVTPSMTITGTAIDNYTLTQPTLLANITAKVLTVTGATAQNKVYDGNTSATIVGGTLSGIVNMEDVILATATTGTFAISNIGVGINVTPSMTITGTAIGNYTLTQPTLLANITAKVLTVTGATAQNKVYDGNTSATIVGGTLSGIVNLEDVILATATTGTFATSNVGVGINVTPFMTITGTAIGNYTLTQPTLSASITAKILTVTGTTAQNKVYDGNTSATIVGGTLSGIVGSEDVSLAIATTGTFSSPNVGVGIGIASSMTITGTAIGNYALIQPTLLANITAKALTITGANAQNKVYDGNTNATIVGGTLSGIVGLEDVILATATTGSFASSNAGVGINVIPSMTITGTAIGNYTLTQPTLTANITPLSIQITANSGQSKKVGEQDPVFTYLITNGSLIGGDLISGALSRVTGETVGSYPILVGTLTAGSNYSISFISADFEITNNTGIENADFIVIKVYPNPVVDILNVQSAKSMKKILIYSTHGQEVLHKVFENINNVSINISSLQRGYYIIRVVTKENQFVSTKILKD
ncbi:MAG: T9SS type A sorting domain-containing protein [Bacteroidales bacterium]|nr:T9SS type A sorting domain-containing protein [Bacteroidales bacterium]